MSEPRDALDLELSGIWRSALGRPAVRVDDNYFLDLGGDSLALISIISEVKQAFDVELAVADFLIDPTLAAMATQIRSGVSRAPRGPLVQLQAGQAGQAGHEAAYLFPPLAGTPLCYAGFTRALGGEYTLWGLQSEGIEPGTMPLTAMDELADHYLGQMLAVRPPGRWHLIGYSMGGCLAVEVARRLLDRGEQVGLVCVIDMYAPPGDETLSADTIMTNAIRGIAQRLLGGDNDDWAAGGRSVEEQLKEILARGVAAGTVPLDYDLDMLRRQAEVHLRNRLAVGGYRPEPYRGTITLIRSRPPGVMPGENTEDEQDYLGWARLADVINLHEVLGDHFSIMDYPTVAEIAAIIRGYLAQAGPPATAR